MIGVHVLTVPVLVLITITVCSVDNFTRLIGVQLKELLVPCRIGLSTLQPSSVYLTPPLKLYPPINWYQHPGHRYPVKGAETLMVEISMLI